MSQKNQELKEKTATVSFAVNLFLFAVKIFFAYLSNASLLILDAIHSLVDTLSSLMVYASIKVSTLKSKRLTNLFTQLENLASILISFIILYGAYEVGKRALSPSLVFGSRVPNFTIAIVGTLIATSICYIISRYKIHVGAKTGSTALVADGYESRMDMYSSVVVLVSLLGSLVGIQFNKIAGVLIALFIAKLGVEVLMRGVRAFVGGLYLDMEEAKDVSGKADTLGLFSGMHVDTDRYVHRVRNMWKYGLATLCILYLLSGIFVVESDEQGVVKRFGKETMAGIKPGLHYRLPYPIESVQKPKVTEVKRMEMGFRYEKDPYRGDKESELWESTHSLGRYRKVSEESLMITGDENIVDVNMIIQYKIWDPSRYLFNTQDPVKVVRDISEASLRQVVGSKKIDDALTSGKSEIQEDVKDMIQSALDRYDTGLTVITVQLQDVHPPVEVAQSFKDVASAREDKNRKINDAEAYRNDVLPKARGNAEKLILEAEAYRAARINSATGDTKRFLSLYNEYINHRNITRTRLYLETMEYVLPYVRIYVVDSAGSGKNSIAAYSTLMPLMDSRTPVIQKDGEELSLGEESYGGFGGRVEALDEKTLFGKIDETPTFL